MKTIVSLVLLTLAFVSPEANAEQQTKEAKRIIALAPHIVENLFQIGAGDRVIGTTDHSDYPEAAKNIPRIGNYARLNIEDILAADPDLIIAWKTGNPTDDLERLAKFGIRIVYSDPHTPEDVAGEFRRFGQLTGLEQQAEQQAAKYLAKLDNIKQQYQDKPWVSAFYELWPRPLTTIAANAWPQHLINICRASNPFVQSKTDYPQINLEQVVLKNPELIIQPRSSARSITDEINWKQWSEIPAVKNNAFIHPDENQLHRMTSRALNELTLLCQQIDEIRERHYKQAGL